MISWSNYPVFCKVFSHHVLLLICFMHDVFELFILVIKQGVNLELRQKSNCRYCFMTVVLEFNNVWSCEKRVHFSVHASSVRYLIVMLIMDVLNTAYQVSRRQIFSYLLLTFSADFTTNYIARIWQVLLNIYFIADPCNKGLSALIYTEWNNLVEEFIW